MKIEMVIYTEDEVRKLIQTKVITPQMGAEFLIAQTLHESLYRRVQSRANRWWYR